MRQASGFEGVAPSVEHPLRACPCFTPMELHKCESDCAFVAVNIIVLANVTVTYTIVAVI